MCLYLGNISYNNNTNCELNYLFPHCLVLYLYKIQELKTVANIVSRWKLIHYVYSMYVYKICGSFKEFQDGSHISNLAMLRRPYVQLPSKYCPSLATNFHKHTFWCSEHSQNPPCVRFCCVVFKTTLTSAVYLSLHWKMK